MTNLDSTEARRAQLTTTLDFEADRLRVLALESTAPRSEIDGLLRAMHVKYHHLPRQHVGVHATWMKVEARRRAYHRAAFHAFAGYVVAGPASLVQRYTGFVVPAFDARR